MLACFVCLCLVSCAPNVISVSGLTILDCPFISSNVNFLYRIVATLKIEMVFPNFPKSSSQSSLGYVLSSTNEMRSY